MKTLGAIAASGSPPIPGLAATSYDGAADYYRRSAALAGAGLSNGVVISMWAKPNLSASRAILQPVLFYNAGVTAIIYPVVRCGAYFDAATSKNRIWAEASNTVDGFYRDYLAPDNIDDGGFHNILMGVDFATGTLQLYVDDVLCDSDPNGYNTGVGFPGGIDLSLAPEWNIGASHLTNVGAAFDITLQFYKDCLSELFFTGVGAVPDFSQEANRRKFIKADGGPAYLGARGQAPLGVIPLVYGPAGDGTNLGIGGDFSPVGSTEACSTNP